MKINQIIRNRRKELSLTQEQIADCLGVSTPAVNKWEKGSTYPDITLLPALARLLKIDLNTLLSFQEDLSDAEIENFVNGLDQAVQERGYAIAFQSALDKIQEYPTCEPLLYSAIFYLEGALTLYGVPDPEHYQAVLEPLYRRLADSSTQEIRDAAISMLVSYARNQGDFSRAEDLIHMLPFSEIDREEHLGVLYRCQGKYEDARKLWTHRILKGVTDIQLALINLLELSLLDHHTQDAAYFADLYESVTCKFSFPEWMRYNAHLQIALENQDCNQCLAILKKMLPAMKQEWHPQDDPLYRSIHDDGTTFLSSRIADSLLAELSSKEDYSFLRDCPGFADLLAQVRS